MQGLIVTAPVTSRFFHRPIKSESGPTPAAKPHAAGGPVGARPTGVLDSQRTQRVRPLRIALIGSSAVPSASEAFEIAAEEIGRRLVDRGHEVTVYGRAHASAVGEHPGVRLPQLPALHLKALETLGHTALSTLVVAQAALQRGPDAAFVVSAATTPLVAVLRLRGIPTSEMISYGARILHNVPVDRLAELGLRPGGYHLVVARGEPNDRVGVIVNGFLGSSASRPLVVLGSSPGATGDSNDLTRLAASDSRIHILDEVREQGQLDQLYAHAVTYLDGHSVGGTNHSLLHAMGAGTASIAWDTGSNREVLGASGSFFGDAGTLAGLIEDAELSPHRTAEVAGALQGRAQMRYNWDSVALNHENVALRLADGSGPHRQPTVA